MADFEPFLSGGGEMGARIRAHDWGTTPLGPPEAWPHPLRSALGICLHSTFPTSIWWGPDFRLLYNDAYAPILGPRHPDALGQSGRAIWSEIWDVIGAQFEGVVARRQGLALYEQLLEMRRYGEVEETYWDYSLTPIAGEDGRVAGVLNQAKDVTGQILGARNDGFLIELDRQLRTTTGVRAIMDRAVAMLAGHLGVGRVGYAEIDTVAQEVVIEACWTDGAMADISGRFPLGAFVGKQMHSRLAQGEPLEVADVLADPRFADPALLQRYALIQLRAGLVVPLVRSGRYSAAIFAQDDEPRLWRQHEVTLLRAAAERVWQDVSRARAEAALRDSEQRHRLIFEQAHDIILTADLDQVITSCNPAAAEAMGAAVDRIVGRSIADFVSPTGFQQTSSMLRRKLDQGGETEHEIEVVRPDGRAMRWEIVSTLATDRDGKPIGLQAIARDVTERRAFQERQTLLINELNHRVKNMLALVQALALQTFRPGRDPATAAADFDGRLHALAAAHDLLTREQWEGATLAELVSRATRAHGDANRIAAAGPHVSITPRAAVSIVMALHELCTNAAKYGALSVPHGHVAIAWSNGDGRLRLAWREQGGPPVSPPASSGFGVRMIERALAADLGGTVEIDFASDGLVCTIDAPLPEPEPAR